MRRLPLPTIGLVFLRHAGLVFGGAVSIGPSLEAELVQRRRALERSDFWLSYGLSQMMPSIILANFALSLGNKLRGPSGAAAALAGLLVPSFVFAMALTLLYLSNRDLALVQAGMRTALPAVLGIVAVAAFRLARHHLERPTNLALVAAVAAGFLYGVSPLVLLAAAGAVGVVLMRPGHGA